MRAVVQRVQSASVTVDDKIVARIDRGLLVYVGVATDDGPNDAEQLASKIAYLRIFEDPAGKMNLDVSSVGGAVLVVSNFTLMADTRQGRRPAFIAAARPEAADHLYQAVCEKLGNLGLRVQTGRFESMALNRSTMARLTSIGYEG
jgi:D-tyrosyl-tRNA(Tyr) deacylase